MYVLTRKEEERSLSAEVERCCRRRIVFGFPTPPGSVSRMQPYLVRSGLSLEGSFKATSAHVDRYFLVSTEYLLYLR